VKRHARWGTADGMLLLLQPLPLLLPCRCCCSCCSTASDVPEEGQAGGCAVQQLSVRGGAMSEGVSNGRCFAACQLPLLSSVALCGMWFATWNRTGSLALATVAATLTPLSSCSLQRAANMRNHTMCLNDTTPRSTASRPLQHRQPTTE
jgi:hypothetical protein